jgi:hypothetical protein
MTSSTTTTAAAPPRGLPPAQRPWAFEPRVRRLGGLGLAGAASFGVAVIALHYLEPGMTPHDHFASEYAITPSGLLMKAAFVLLAAGVLGLALGVRASLAPGRRVRWAWGLMVAAACGYGASAAFDTDPSEALATGTDPTWHSMLHDLSGMVAFLGTISAAFVLRGVFRRAAPWQPMAGVAALFGTALTALLGVLLASPAAAVGVSQRAFLVVLLVWFGVLGSWMRRRVADPTGPSTADAAARAAVTRRLAAVALLGALAYPVAVLAVALLEPDLSPASDFVSDHALGRGGLVLTTGFLTLAAAHVALGLGLRRSLAPSRRRTFASWALVAVGLETALSGLFPSLLWTDPTTGEPGWHQVVHEVGGLTSLPVVVGVLVALTGAYRRDPRWRPLAGVQRMFTVVFLVALVVFLAAPESAVGVAQRSFIAVIVTWFGVTALYLGSVCRPAPAEGGGAGAGSPGADVRSGTRVARP